jgi:hypothetical protein
MQLPDLNLDVLFQILEELSTQHLAYFALTSQQTYRVATLCMHRHIVLRGMNNVRSSASFLKSPRGAVQQASVCSLVVDIQSDVANGVSVVSVVTSWA